MPGRANYENMTDHELIKLHQNGDLCAFDVLALRYQEWVTGFVAQRLGVRKEDERVSDLVNETFFQLWRSLKSYRFKGFRGFLGMIALRRVQKMIEKIKLERCELARYRCANATDRHRGGRPFLDDLDDSDETARNESDRQQARKDALRQLAAERPDEAKVLALFLARHNFQEISRLLLGISESTARRRFESASERVRKLYYDEMSGDG